MQASRFNIYKIFGENLVLFNLMTQSLRIIPIEDIHALKSNNDSGFELIKDLQNEGMLIEDNLDELKVYSFWRNKEVHFENKLTVEFFIDMELNECLLLESLDTISFLIRELSSKYLKLILIAENPSQNYKSIEIVCVYLNKLKKTGIACEISLDFNGHDLSNVSLLKILKENSIHCNILVDKNNWMKYRINEEELYDKIIKNIFMLIKNDIKLSLKGHFYDLNINKIKKVFCKIPAKYRKKIIILIDSTINELYKIDRDTYCEKDILNNIFSLTDWIYKLGYPISLFDSDCFQCGARIDNSLVIDSTGSIYKCRYHRNLQTEICNIRENKDRIVQQVIASRLSKLAYRTEKSCCKCTVLPLCRGGCLLEYDAVNGGICNKLYYIELVSGFIKIKVEN